MPDEPNWPTAMYADNPLFVWLDSLTYILSSERPTVVSGPFGTHGVGYFHDIEIGEDYAIVAFMLPDDMYAEIESGTRSGRYGQLEGIRIYLDEVE
jgi:hypothetical protein